MIRWLLSALVLLSVCPSVRAEVRTTGVIAEGTRWESRYHVIQGDEPGPTVVLVGGVHGDEPAGAQAAEQICQWPLRKGRLVVIPRANPAALDARTRLIPGEKAGSRDVNRNFPKPGGPAEATGDLAAALWSTIASQKPDWLIDLHEGYGFHRTQPKSVGSSIISGNSPDEVAMATALLAAVNETIPLPDRRFVHLRVPVDGSLARAAAAHLGAKSMILETTSRNQRLSVRTRQHQVMVHAFLVKAGMIRADDNPHIMEPAAAVEGR